MSKSTAGFRAHVSFFYIYKQKPRLVRRIRTLINLFYSVGSAICTFGGGGRDVCFTSLWRSHVDLHELIKIDFLPVAILNIFSISHLVKIVRLRTRTQGGGVLPPALEIIWPQEVIMIHPLNRSCIFTSVQLFPWSCRLPFPDHTCASIALYSSV
jgi:hypothetical protein